MSVILCTPHRVPFCHAFFCTTIRSCAVLWSSPTIFGSLSVCIILLAKSKILLNLVNTAQRKIPVDLHFIVRLRHKASGAALGLSCAVCFEQPAGVFAGCGAVCQAKILASLKIKNGISLTPLN